MTPMLPSTWITLLLHLQVTIKSICNTKTNIARIRGAPKTTATCRRWTDSCVHNLGQSGLRHQSKAPRFPHGWLSNIRLKGSMQFHFSILKRHQSLIYHPFLGSQEWLATLPECPKSHHLHRSPFPQSAPCLHLTLTRSFYSRKVSHPPHLLSLHPNLASAQANLPAPVKAHSCWDLFLSSLEFPLRIFVVGLPCCSCLQCQTGPQDL